MPNPDPVERPVRKCNCSGACAPQGSIFSRRQFLEIVAAGSAGLIASPALAAFDLPSDQLEKWRRSLFSFTKPLRYLSDKHTDARMHLGGIGTGNFEIGCDGQFTTWQLFNTLRDGQVPFYFLVKADSTAKLLQTSGGPDWPRVKQIEMTGEYPMARLRFVDGDLPVDLDLSAFSPFAPLDYELSSVPAAAFVFRIHNPGKQVRKVSLGALIQNPVGYEADGENASVVNPCFGGNVNEVLAHDGAHGLLLRAAPAPEPTLDKPVAIYTLANLKNLDSPPPDRPTNLTLKVLEDSNAALDKPANAVSSVIWLEDAAATLSALFLGEVRDWVKAGATLLFAGSSQPLLKAYASWTGGRSVSDAAARPDIVFEDFEKGYDNWQVEGEAFGKEPSHGTLPNQQNVSGFLGRGLVNTYLGSDDTIGRLVSKPFQIQRRFIRFLIGGGHYEQTQVRLVVGGKVVHSAAGKDNERLEPAIWDVSALDGQTAHLEIVDAQKGGWGHINVDQIEFSDLPGSRELMLVLEELLPLRFSEVRTAAAPSPNKGNLEFENFTPQPGATRVVANNGLVVWSRPLGQGKVVLSAGPVLQPAQAGISHARQRAYSFLCALTGATYTSSPGIHPKAPGFGTLALMTLCPDASVLSPFDDWNQAWKLFSDDGHFGAADQSPPATPTAQGRTVCGGVAASVTVPAGQTLEVPFVLAWHYPNKYNPRHEWMGCHYATQWPDARAVALDAIAHLPAWRQKTEQFREVFYDSSLPYWLLDCLSANAAIIRHIGIVFRIAKGDVYGWEGSNGCCDPTCTHVWGYEQSLSRLFPQLEKEMRRIDFKHQQRPDGGINNRTEFPSPARPTGEQPFADGHASCILKAYREALNHSDEGFFKEYWPGIKRAAEYLIARDAASAGGQPAGILQDDQWNTYDEALHGVTTFVSGYYLAALRAAEEWGRRLGDTATADRFAEIYAKGQSRLIELCWNGEYFQQHLPDYAQRQGEVGPGCMSDQLIGQWWAHQLGLGYILPREKVVSSLRAIFKYNFKSDLTNWKHAPRAFAGASDKGLIICTWPKGGRPPAVMLYSDEVWTGVEYQVAAHLIYEGLVEEGLAVVKAARERYDGIPRPPISRNPWNEIECGGHYARAMSSWSLLLALSGWHYDAPRGHLRFTPRHGADKFKSFFAGPEGWGSVSQSRAAREQVNGITVSAGRFTVKELGLQVSARPGSVEVKQDGLSLKHTVGFTDGLLKISVAKPAQLTARQSLQVRLAI